MVVFLVMQTLFLPRQSLWILETESISENAKILWNNIRSFERHASMFWKYFDWSQLFFCEKSTHILGLQQVGKVNILFCTICSECPIKMFPDVFFFWRVGSPVPKLNSPFVSGGGFLYSPNLGYNSQNISCADSRCTYIFFFFGGEEDWRLPIPLSSN